MSMKFLDHFEAQFSANVKVLKFDSGGEYISRAFHDYPTKSNYFSKIMPLYTSEGKIGLPYIKIIIY